MAENLYNIIEQAKKAISKKMPNPTGASAGVPGISRKTITTMKGNRTPQDILNTIEKKYPIDYLDLAKIITMQRSNEEHRFKIFKIILKDNLKDAPYQERCMACYVNKHNKYFDVVNRKESDKVPDKNLDIVVLEGDNLEEVMNNFNNYNSIMVKDGIEDINVIPKLNFIELFTDTITTKGDNPFYKYDNESRKYVYVLDNEFMDFAKASIIRALKMIEEVGNENPWAQIKITESATDQYIPGDTADAGFGL